MRSVSMIVFALVAAGAQGGVVTPFTETFTFDNANWRDGATNPLAWNAGGFVSTSGDLNSAGPFGLTLFRGQDGFDSSGDAFVGDYVAGGINRISLDIRHDAGQDLTFAVRVAVSGPSPAFAVISPVAVTSGEWTTLTFDLDYSSPFYFAEGAPGEAFFNSVASAVGNLQISVNRPEGLDTPLLVNFDLDNVSITPSPASVTLLGLGGLAAARRRRA